MFVKPALGRNVRDPITKRLLPEDGKEVPETTYWVRRIASGDAVEVQETIVMIPEHEPVVADEVDL